MRASSRGAMRSSVRAVGERAQTRRPGHRQRREQRQVERRAPLRQQRKRPVAVASRSHVLGDRRALHEHATHRFRRRRLELLHAEERQREADRRERREVAGPASAGAAPRSRSPASDCTRATMCRRSGRACTMSADRRGVRRLRRGRPTGAAPAAPCPTSSRPRSSRRARAGRAARRAAPSSSDTRSTDDASVGGRLRAPNRNRRARSSRSSATVISGRISKRSSASKRRRPRPTMSG